jgi:hypothetical protein
MGISDRAKKRDQCQTRQQEDLQTVDNMWVIHDVAPDTSPPLCTYLVPVAMVPASRNAWRSTSQKYGIYL